ncbi:glycerate 2-kinase [Bacillus pseudomycoides]|nr:glycerate 2-kinase [Bacillus pseudomycoides]
MKIIIASDSYKESLTALEVCKAVEKGFRSIYPEAEYIKIPIADGGEGTVQALVDATQGKIVKIPVTGPLGNVVEGFYGLSSDERTAFIEMAAASGLHHVPLDKRNPLLTTTKGTGEIILHALEQGVHHIVLGLGGSATNDGGAGMLSALGVRFFDSDNRVIEPNGGNLNYITSFDMSQLDSRLKKVKIEAACDVENPLTGRTGASFVFGRQKGATDEMIERLDCNLKHYAQLIKQTFHIDIECIPGAGAAGGLGAAIVAFLHGTLRKGIDIVLDYTNFNAHLQDADLVITGEGRIDAQTVYGKAPIGVAKRAKKYNLPVIAIAGAVHLNHTPIYEEGVDAVFSVVSGVMTLEEAYEMGKKNIYITARNIAAVWKLGLQKHLYS